MQTWRFRIWLSDAPDDLIEMADKLYEAGCDDSSPGSFEGRAHTDFHRDAETLSEAIRTAVEDIGKAGMSVDSIVVTQDEVATWPA